MTCNHSEHTYPSRWICPSSSRGVFWRCPSPRVLWPRPGRGGMHSPARCIAGRARRCVLQPGRASTPCRRRGRSAVRTAAHTPHTPHSTPCTHPHDAARAQWTAARRHGGGGGDGWTLWCGGVVMWWWWCDDGDVVVVMWWWWCGDDDVVTMEIAIMMMNRFNFFRSFVFTYFMTKDIFYYIWDEFIFCF